MIFRTMSPKPILLKCFLLGKAVKKTLLCVPHKELE